MPRARKGAAAIAAPVAEAEVTMPAAAEPMPPAPEPNELSALSGTRHATATKQLLNSTINAVASPEHPQRDALVGSVLGAMAGIAARDTVEGMLASHLTVLHHGALDLLARSQL